MKSQTGLSSAILMISLSQFTVSLGMNLTDPLLPIYASSFNVSYATIGLVMSSFGYTIIFFEIPGGPLADRTGRKPLILLGYKLMAAAQIIAGLAQSHIELMIFRMINGVARAAVQPHPLRSTFSQ